LYYFSEGNIPSAEVKDSLFCFDQFPDKSSSLEFLWYYFKIYSWRLV